MRLGVYISETNACGCGRVWGRRTGPTVLLLGAGVVFMPSYSSLWMIIDDDDDDGDDADAEWAGEKAGKEQDVGFLVVVRCNFRGSAN
jgi:hypothetical protein